MKATRPPGSTGASRTGRVRLWRAAIVAIVPALLIALGVPQVAYAATTNGDGTAVIEQQDTKPTGSTAAVAPSDSKATVPGADAQAAPQAEGTSATGKGATESAAPTKTQEGTATATAEQAPSSPQDEVATPSDPARPTSGTEGVPPTAGEGEGQPHSSATDESAQPQQTAAAQSGTSAEGASAAQTTDEASGATPGTTVDAASAQSATSDPASGEGFDTNLEGTAATTGSATIVTGDKGLQITSDGATDAFWISNSEYGDVTYSADVEFTDQQGAATLIFHSNGDLANHYAYAANINGASGECRVFKFGDSADLAKSTTVPLSPDNRYHLSITMVGKHIVFSVNGTVVANTGDYTVDNGQSASTNAHYGQDDALLSGKLGLLTWNGSAWYQNVHAEALTADNTPQLKDLSLSGDHVDMNFAYQADNYVYIGYVRNAGDAVALNVTPSNGNSTVTVRDQSGNIVDPQHLALGLGENHYTMTVENGEAKVVYQLRLFREGADDSYYNEDWRDQYHYSVKNGWGNDPCGLVYFEGTYHFFYQFYTDTVWGPMHWGHATSTDLIHWTNQPIALYPDEYGAMFSGCAVAADHSNAPDLFAEGESGIVIIVTGNGKSGADGYQRLIMAVSHDGGKTFQKNEEAKVLLDSSSATENPLGDPAFRDPKVFRYDNKWFLVCAGGPWRVYSSDDLIHWSVESTNKDLTTECPDLYPVKTSDGTVKWILDRGGRLYQVGDFRQVDGKYTFVQDPGTTDYTMNFGRDSYAAMTYFRAGVDFGTAGHVNAPDDIIAENWMNTWDDYCNLVSSKTGNDVWCGTYNIMTRQSLVRQDDGSYRLAQTPLSEYESLRGDSVTVRGATLGTGENPFQDFHGTSYEIVAHITPVEGQPTVGFDVRVGNGQKTRVSYDFSTHTVTIDRSQSGIILSNKFSTPDHQAEVVTNADGSIDLHIFVDRMSVEVFTADDTVSGANQIFPTGYPDGLIAFAENGTATLDATVYQLASIWTDKGEQSSTPTGISVDTTSVAANPGDTNDVRVWVTPGYANQDWTVSTSDPSVAWVVRTDTGLSIVASKPGTTTITIASAADPSITKTITVTVRANEFKTNVNGLTPTAGTWYIDGRAYHIDGAELNAFLMSSEEYSLDGNFSYEVDVNYNDSVTNLVFGSQTTDPFGGCYAIQLRSDGTLRLFDFKGDHTFTQVAADLSYGHTYHVTATVEDGVIHVSIDGKELIAYQLTDQDKADGRAYEKGYVGLGAWDTKSTTFESFYVYDTAHPKPTPTPPPTPGQCHHHHHGWYGCGYRYWWSCDHAGRCSWHWQGWCGGWHHSGHHHASHQHGFQGAWGFHRTLIGYLAYCQRVCWDMVRWR